MVFGAPANWPTSRRIQRKCGYPAPPGARPSSGAFLSNFSTVASGDITWACAAA